MRLCLDGHGDMRHPHVFLVHRIGHPKVRILGSAVTLLNASHILRTVALVVAPITHRGYLTLNEIQSGVFIAVFRQRDCQWPAIFRWVIDCSIGAITKALSPDFRIAVYKSFGTFYWLCPRQTTIGRCRRQGVLPQSGNLSVGQRIVAVSLILLVQWNQRIVAVGFFYPLHPIAGIGKNLFTGRTYILGSLGIEGKGLASLTSLTSITSIPVDEKYRPQRAVFLHFADDAPQTIAVVGVVLLVESNTIIAKRPQLSALRDIPSDALVHNGNEVMGLLGTVGLLKTLRHLHLWEENLWITPRITVRRSLIQGV